MDTIRYYVIMGINDKPIKLLTNADEAIECVTKNRNQGYYIQIMDAYKQQVVSNKDDDDAIAEYYNS